MGDNSSPKSAHFPLRFWHSFADLAHSADGRTAKSPADEGQIHFVLDGFAIGRKIPAGWGQHKLDISRHRPKFSPADAFSSSNLSDDHCPSSTLRLVRKWLGELAGRKEAEGQEIRAQLCRMAIGHLERTEADIGQAERRQEAQGQGEWARELRRKIRDRTDRAMAEAYAKLLMEGEKRSGRIRKGMVRREEEEKKGERRRRRRKRRQRKVEEKEERRKMNGDPEGKKDERGGRESREERGESMEEGIGEREVEEEGGRRRREGKGKESREGAAKGRAKEAVQPRTNNTLGAMFNDTLPLLIATGRSTSESKGMMEKERQGGREKETEGMRSEGQRMEDEKTEMKKLKEYSGRREPGKEGKWETGKKVNWKEEEHQKQGGRAARRRRLKEEEEEEEETLFPEEVKSSANVCPYCEEQNPLFRHHDFLLHHFANDCIWLCRCDFCDKLVEIHRLNEHQLVRCPFVGETLAECQMCGIARYPDEPNEHPKCRYAHPPPGGAWCPLCLALVRNAESRAEWVRHLTSECRNNFRRVVGNPRKDNDRHSELMAHLEQALARLSVDSPADGNHSLHPRPRFVPQSKTGETAAKEPLGGRRGQIDAQQLKTAVRRLNHERRVKAMERNTGRIGRRKEEERGEGESSDSTKSEE